MAASILVAYATRYGSTKEVAEAIGTRLRSQGLDADVKPAGEAGSLDGFDAVVLGAPLYIGSFLKEANAFLEKHRAELERKPVAVFTLGPLHDNELDEARGQLDKALGKVASWLTPVSTEMFVGKYDPAKLRVADKLAAVIPASPLHGVPASDDRDWAAIDAWADTLPAVLRLETTAGV